MNWLGGCSSRAEALHCALDCGISMTALAAELCLSVARVSQLIARAEAAVREHMQASAIDPKRARQPEWAEAKLTSQACWRGRNSLAFRTFRTVWVCSSAASADSPPFVQ